MSNKMLFGTGARSCRSSGVAKWGTAGGLPGIGFVINVLPAPIRSGCHSATPELLQLLTPVFRHYSRSGAGPILALILLAAGCAAERSPGQWVPPDALRRVPVRADCRMTKRDVGVSIQPTLFYPNGAIFLCPEREREIEARRPGASRFFLVHEYGHLAMRSREEAVADEWAAKQLGKVPAERVTLRAILCYFVDEGTLFDPSYGTGLDRALRVARAAGMPVREWPPGLLAYAKTQEDERANGMSLTLRMQDGYTNAAQMVISIDRQPIGVLSNVEGERPLRLSKLSPGRHLIQALQVWLYHVEPSGGKSEVARRLEAECGFESTGQRVIQIELRFDGETLSINVNERR
jgi:hypothetical protein